MSSSAWVKLVDLQDDCIWRGALLRMPGKDPYESVVDFLVIEYQQGFALLVASGYKCGIIRQILPAAALMNPDVRAISRLWLIENWAHWIDIGAAADVWIRRDSPVPESLPG